MIEPQTQNKKPLTEAEAQEIINKINAIYRDFELEIEKLRQKRDQLIDQAGQQLDQEKIKKIRQQLK